MSCRSSQSRRWWTVALLVPSAAWYEVDVEGAGSGWRQRDVALPVWCRAARRARDREEVARTGPVAVIVGDGVTSFVGAGVRQGKCLWSGDIPQRQWVEVQAGRRRHECSSGGTGAAPGSRNCYDRQAATQSTADSHRRPPPRSGSHHSPSGLRVPSPVRPDANQMSAVCCGSVRALSRRSEPARTVQTRTTAPAGAAAAVQPADAWRVGSPSVAMPTTVPNPWPAAEPRNVASP